MTDQISYALTGAICAFSVDRGYQAAIVVRL
jgi:hypothetical protein